MTAARYSRERDNVSAPGIKPGIFQKKTVYITAILPLHLTYRSYTIKTIGTNMILASLTTLSLPLIETVYSRIYETADLTTTWYYKEGDNVSAPGIKPGIFPKKTVFMTAMLLLHLMYRSYTIKPIGTNMILASHIILSRYATWQGKGDIHESRSTVNMPQIVAYTSQILPI